MILKISKDFTTSPGPRYQSEGKFSGELFRNSVLYPAVAEAINSNHELVIDLDGTSGYGTSFLEESFGGLIRENHLSHSKLTAVLKFVSKEEPDLITEIEEYMQDAATDETGE